MTDQTPKHASLVEALAAAQGEFEKIGRNREGQEGNRRFKYGDLSSILAAVVPALSRHGIAHTTRFDHDPDLGTVIVTELHHGSDKMASKLPVAVTGVGIMQAGKNMSYLRRYALQALLDVCPEDEDQDGDDLGDARQPQARQQSHFRGTSEPRNLGTSVPPARDEVEPHDPETGEVVPTPPRQPTRPQTPPNRHADRPGGRHADAPPALADGRGWTVRLPGEEPRGPMPLQSAWTMLYRACKGDPNADGMTAAEIQEAKDMNRALYEAVTPKARTALDELLVQRSPKVA